MLNDHHSPEIYIALFCTAFGAAAVMTRIVTGFLLRHAILDQPNARSSHSIARPRGGGLGVMSIIILMMTVLGVAYHVPLHYWAMITCAIFLMGVSWLDDLRGLSPGLRLLAQFLAVTGAALMMPPDFLILQGVAPLLLDRIVMILAWVWFVNIMNFMDGIDGITGMQTVAIGIGVPVVLLASHTVSAPWLLDAGFIIAGAGLGFLVWNWHRALVFIGEVGAIPLGFVCGWYLMNLAAHGHLLPAVLIPLYYCVDATFTLVFRGWMKRRLWQPHRSHCFQRAIQGGYNHAEVVLMLAMLNVVLLGCALIAATPINFIHSILAFCLACGACALLIAHFFNLFRISREEL